MKHARSMKRYNTTPSVIEADIALPHDETLESAVLGALLLESQAIADVRQVLTRNAFYKEENAVIYDIICSLDDKGETADLYTVSQQAKTVKISAVYLAQLTQTVGSGVQAVAHARRLEDLRKRRELILFGHELVARVMEQPDGSGEWAQQRIDEIAGCAVSVSLARSARDILAETMRDLEQRQIAAQRGACVGIPTGLAHLDRVTGGWRGGQLIVLAGRPAMGKTAVSLLFARAAAESGVAVCYYSLEMPDVQLAGRMLVGVSGVNATAFRSGEVDADSWNRLENGVRQLASLPLWIFDIASTTMQQIRSRSRAMQRKGRCDMVVIDYLQLISSTEDRRSSNREREVAEISRAAKLLAKELDIPVILLAQLSRKVEERTDKTPLLSDLRESGAIEQDADMVIFIDRPAVYGIREFDGGKYGTIASQCVGRLTIAKNREGGTGFIPFLHNESLTRIGDYGQQPESRPF